MDDVTVLHHFMLISCTFLSYQRYNGSTRHHTFLVVLTHADYDQRLSEIIDSIISSRRQKHGFLSSNSGKSDQESMFAIEVNANDIKLVTEIARAAGFRIERKITELKNIGILAVNNDITTSSIIVTTTTTTTTAVIVIVIVISPVIGLIMIMRSLV
uniref:ACT domain-containing protein n=1 Tax=Heterorhabditis bacteriophora TaxID=37862 RepID=A0A1I7WEK6_HETBA